MKYLEVGNYLKLKVCNPLPSVDYNTLCLDMADPNVNAVAEVEDEETEKATVRSYDLTQYFSLP